MSSLNEMTNKELGQMVKLAEAELKRREIIEEATQEILKVLKFYSISFEDLDGAAFKKRGTNKTDRTSRDNNDINPTRKPSASEGRVPERKRKEQQISKTQAKQNRQEKEK